jgi:hypothetical protein
MNQARRFFRNSAGAAAILAGIIANAAFHATGVRVPDLPITIDKILGLRQMWATSPNR